MEPLAPGPSWRAQGRQLSDTEQRGASRGEDRKRETEDTQSCPDGTRDQLGQP